jgi:hypothetical protein
MIHALGYAIGGIGINGGLNAIVNPGNTLEVYLTRMYGYNATSSNIFGGKVTNTKTYYGPTIGAGLKINFNSISGLINMELLAPIRDEPIRDSLPPVAISLGYHWVF